MFFYLSFLRPPPLQAHPQKPISITPQITNDLRTEFFHDNLDIYYAWVKPDTTRAGSLMTPTKLTTWREANAYKEVTVHPPALKVVPEGQSWQLLLCAPISRNSSSRGRSRVSTQDLALTVDLSAKPFGTQPFPVLSLPILFSAKTVVEDAAKQRNIERVVKFPMLKQLSGELASLGPLKISENLSFDLDKKVWDSGIGLASWLTANWTSIQDGKDHSPISQICRRIRDGSELVNIVELGAGTGLVSIALATLLNANHQSRQNDSSSSDSMSDSNDDSKSPTAAALSSTSIFTTDLPSAMEVIAENVDLNKSCLSPIEPRPLVLDWEEELPGEVHSAKHSANGVDLIIMADVTYNTASFPALVSTLKRLRSLSTVAKKTDAKEETEISPLVLLAYKERHPDERSLWDLAHSIGLIFTEIDEIPGAGGAPVEIYLGRFSGSV